MPQQIGPVDTTSVFQHFGPFPDGDYLEVLVGNDESGNPGVAQVVIYQGKQGQMQPLGVIALTSGLYGFDGGTGVDFMLGPDDAQGNAPKAVSFYAREWFVGEVKPDQPVGFGNYSAGGNVNGQLFSPTHLAGGQAFGTAGMSNGLDSQSTPCLSVAVKAFPSSDQVPPGYGGPLNTGAVYVGRDGVDTTTGIILLPNDGIAFDISNVQLVFFAVDVNGDGVSFLVTGLSTL